MALKKNRKRPGGGSSGQARFFRVLLLLGLLVATLVAVFVLLILRPYENQVRAPIKSAKVSAPALHSKKGGGSPKLSAPSSSSQKGGGSRLSSPLAGPPISDREPPYLAIVIDDMGYQQQLDDELLHLNLNLSFAFLPYGPHTGVQSALANQLGRDVLLHLPMEPIDPRWNSGPGTIRVGMNHARLQKIFEQDLAQVPQALGINNHMGSRFTSDRQGMQDFLALVRDHQLFFLDSVTSQDSLGYALAQEMGIKTCRRQIFLDNARDPVKIIGQIRELLATAERQGWAVGIGHPSLQTLEALRAARPEILRRVKLVGVSHLAH